MCTGSSAQTMASFQIDYTNCAYAAALALASVNASFTPH